MDVFSSGRFRDAGVSLGDLLQTILFGNASHPIRDYRQVRQLANDNNDVFDLFVSIFYIMQGSFKEAHTIVVGSDFGALISTLLI